MLIGFIGVGVVGSTVRDVLAETYDTCFYDPKYENTKIIDVINSDIVFISVPTPTDNQLCDLSIMNDIMDKLNELKYSGIMCIKSTVIPETTFKYITKYNNDKICFCPEFLRERCAHDDFKYNNKNFRVENDDPV